MTTKGKNEDLKINFWGIKPLKTKVKPNNLSIIGNETIGKTMFLNKIIKKYKKLGFSVVAYSYNGALSSMHVDYDMVNEIDIDKLMQVEESKKILVVIDDSLSNKDFNRIKPLIQKNNNRFIYYGSGFEKNLSKHKWFEHTETSVEFVGKKKVVIKGKGSSKEIRTLNLGNWTSKKVAIGIVILIVGFVIGGSYQMRSVPLIGSGNYSLASNDVLESGVLYSTPDGVAIGIMNSIKSEAKEEDVSKAVKNIQSQPNVGVLSVQSGYYKTSKGLEAIVDFGLTSKIKIDKAMESDRIKDTAWKSYVNRKVSYVVLNTKAYNSTDDEKKDENESRKALEANDLTVLSDNTNISAVSDVATTSSQFTQLPLYSDASSMEKIKKAKTGSILEINVGDFKLLFKMVSDDKSDKNDKAYKDYMTQLACVEVGNELASQVDDNKKIDAKSRIAIEENLKQALMQYATRG